jgi:hypothetical protein
MGDRMNESMGTDWAGIIANILSLKTGTEKRNPDRWTYSGQRRSIYRNTTAAFCGFLSM